MPTYRDKSFVETKALEAANSEEHPSSVENKILADFEVLVRSSYNKNSKKLKEFTKNVKSLYSKMLAPTIEGSEKTEMQNVLENYKSQRQDKYDEKKKLIKNRKYTENKIGNSSAEEISGNHWPFAWMLIFIFGSIFIETIMNGTMLTQATEKGLLGGGGVALAISIFSIMGSLGCGKGFKSLFYTKYSEKLSKKIVAWGIFSCWGIIAVAFHSSIGWYRFALQTNATTTQVILSGVLAGVGLLLACEAFHLGYKWSDYALLSKLQTIDNKIKKKDKDILETKKRAINNLKNKKIEASSEVKKATFSFEDKKSEIIELADIMNKYVLDQNTEIHTTVGVGRDSYNRVKPNYNFPDEIPQINPEKYSLESLPGMQWINSIELSIEKIREDRLKEITAVYETMFSHLHKITDPEEIDQDLLPLPERNNNE